MQLVFMGTPDFAVPALKRLVAEGHTVSAVYTQPDKPQGRGRGVSPPPVKTAALSLGLPVYQPPSLKSEVEKITQLKPDAIVVAAFAQLLPKSILDIPRHGCLNVHPSLLPHHRGASPIAGAILAGDEFTGVTIMLMDPGFDTGPILAQERMPVAPQDTTGSLTTKLSEVGAKLLVSTLTDWVEGKLSPRQQSAEGANYTPKITKKDGEIDWHLSATDIWRRVRAFQPWPGCHTWWHGKMLRIIEASPLVGAQTGQVGQVVSEKKPGGVSIGVQTGDGVLELLKVQPEGKRPMAAEEFSRGQRDFVGALLPC